MAAPTGGQYAIAYQPQQTPAHFTLVAAMAGHPWSLREDMVVADLGCGRGHVAQVLAAANPGWTVFGLDHDAAAIQEARQLAARAGLPNVNFLEVDLGALDGAELAALPQFDVVMAHGVWTWVSDAVRAGILRLLSGHLKPGGLAYLGYNALPGAMADAPLQRLLWHLSDHEASAAAAAHAMERLRGMAGRLPLPRTEMLQHILAEPARLEPAFLAHEFLTPHWRPVFHTELCAALAPTKLDFLGSCNLLEGLPALIGDANQQRILAPLVAADAGEFAKDLLLPRTFRADVFVRGRRRTDPSRLLDAIPVAARTAPPEASPVLRVADGRAALPQPAWAPMAAALAEGPARLGALRHLAPQGTGPHPAELAALLVDSGLALPVFRPPGPAPAAIRLNRAAAAFHAPGGEGRGNFALASAVAAGGLPADPLELALVGAVLGGADAASPAALLTALNPGLGGGQRAEALTRVAAKLAEALPAWRRFGIVPAELGEA